MRLLPLIVGAILLPLTPQKAVAEIEYLQLDYRKLCKGKTSSYDVRNDLTMAILNKAGFDLPNLYKFAATETGKEKLKIGQPDAITTYTGTIVAYLKACATSTGDEQIDKICGTVSGAYDEIKALGTKKKDLETYTFGNLEFVNPGSAAATDSAFVEAMLNPAAGSNYALRCTPKATSDDFISRLNLDKVVVVKSEGDLAKKDIKKRSEASFAYTLDQNSRVADEHLAPEEDAPYVHDITVDFTLSRPYTVKGLSYPWSPDSAETVFSPFTSLSYNYDRNPEKETDNLAFGLQVTRKTPFTDITKAICPFNRVDVDEEELGQCGLGFGTLDLHPGDSYSWTVKYVTDIEERDSKQYVAELQFPLARFTAGAPIISALSFGNRTKTGLTTDVDFVTDYSQIDEIGDKTGLENLSSYWRIGYDATTTLSVSELFGVYMQLQGVYKYRDTIADGPADADLWEASFSFKPDQRDQISYEIKYNRGEDITSLEDKEDWTFGIKIKR